MAIESVIELKVVGLDELEQRLKALNNLTVNFCEGGGNAPPSAEEKQAKEQERTDKKQDKEEDQKAREARKWPDKSIREFQQQMDVARKKQEDFTKAINRGTLDFAKWTTSFAWDAGKKLTGAFMGLTKTIVGAGGLIASLGSIISLAGLIRASQDISKRAYQSTGFGLANPNVVRSFQSTYGKFAGAEDVFSALNIAAANPGSTAIPVLADIMSRTGRPTTTQELRTMEPEQRAIQTMEAMRRASKDKNLRQMLSNPELVQDLGLEGIAGPEVMNRMLQYTDKQFKELTDIYKERRPLTTMDTGTRFAYERFGAQRETGMAAIETQLLTAMKPILDPLNRLFTAIFEKLNKGAGKFKEFIDGLAEDINLFAEAISSGNWDALFANLKEQALAFWKGIEPYALEAWNWFKEKADEAWGWIKIKAGEAWEFITNKFQEKFPKAADAFDDFLYGLGKASEMLNSFFEWLEKVKSSDLFKILDALASFGFRLLEINSKLAIGALETGAGVINKGLEYAEPVTSFIGDMADKAASGANKALEGLGWSSEKTSDQFGKVVDFFKRKGWSEDAAIGLASNFQGESGFNPKAIGDKGKAYGIAQWHPDRQRDFMRVYGKPIQDSTFEEQLEFANYELTQGKEQRAGRKIASASGNEAIWAATKYYERPADIGHAVSARMGFANAYRRSAFRNSQLNTDSYTPSGTTGARVSMGSMSPIINIRSYNNPQDNTAWSFTRMFGPDITDHSH